MPFITVVTNPNAWAMLAIKKAVFSEGECQVFPKNQIPFQGIPPSAPIREWFVGEILAESFEADGSCLNIIDREQIHSNQSRKIGRFCTTYLEYFCTEFALDA